MIKPYQINKLNEKLGAIPEILYHGRISKSVTKEEFYNNLKIFENIDERKDMTAKELKEFGRIYLDCAFHGLYLTPCLGQAMYWSLGKYLKEDECYQIIKLKKIKDVVNLNIKINIIPDLNWTEHIVKNRSKLINYNEYDLVYNYIADGKMLDIKEHLKNESQIDKKLLHKKLLLGNQEFINLYYDSRGYTLRNIIDSLKIYEYKHYQLCISSRKALKYFEVDDIIELPKDYLELHNLKTQVDIRQFLIEQNKYSVMKKEILDTII